MLYAGCSNTIAEVGDDLLRPAIARYREVQQLIATTRDAAIAEGRYPEQAVNSIPAEQRQGLRIYFDTPRLPIVGSGFPTRKQFLNQMLATNAMRSSSFQACIGAILTTRTVLGNLGLSATQQTGQVILCSLLPYKSAISPSSLHTQHKMHRRQH